MQKFNDLLEEKLRIIHWLIDGQGLTGLPISAVSYLTTDDIVRVFNIDRDEIGLILNDKPKEVNVPRFVLGMGEVNISSGVITESESGKKTPFITFANVACDFPVGTNLKGKNLREYDKVGVIITSLESLAVLQHQLNFCREELLRLKYTVQNENLDS